VRKDTAYVMRIAFGMDVAADKNSPIAQRNGSLTLWEHRGLGGDGKRNRQQN
jgi:hypothetical protein